MAKITIGKVVVVIISCLLWIAEINATSSSPAASWRFHVPGIDIGATFNTRSPFQMEYLLDTNTTLTWSASNGCHIYNKSAQLTQIQCREAGVHTISLQEKNGVSMETSQTIMVVDDPMCYSWYLAPVGSSQSVSISTEPESYMWRLWIVDPQYADNREVNLTAILPSQHSADLTSQFIAKRQDPVMDIMPVVMGQKLTVVSKMSHPNLGYWDVTADLNFQDSYQMAVNIQGKPHIAVGNCFIKNTDILISRPKFMLSEVQSTDWTQLRGTNSRPVIVQDACATNVAALLTRDGVYITQDSFVTTHLLWIEKSLVQGLSDPVVGATAFSEYHLFVLTGSKIFVRNTTAEEFILIEELPASGIIGLRGRQTYLTACTRQVHPAVVAWSNNTVYGITISGDISFPQVSRHPLPDVMSRMDFSPGNSSLSIEDVAYTVFPSDIGVTVKLDDANHSVSIVMTLNLESNTWNYLPLHAISSEGFNLVFIAGVSQSLIFWDSRNIYYSLHSGAEIGVISADQCSSHLSAFLKPNETIQQVALRPQGDIVAITSSNDLFYGSAAPDTLIKLPSRAIPVSNFTVFIDALGNVYMLSVVGSEGNIIKSKHHFEEDINIAFSQTQEFCLYKSLVFGQTPQMFHVDIGDSFQLWTHLVHLSSMSISVEVTGSPSRLLLYNTSEISHYEPGWRGRNKTILVYHPPLELQGSTDYENWLSENSGLYVLEMRPSKNSVRCRVPSKKVVYFNVGCPPGRHLQIRIPEVDMQTCQAGFNSSIMRDDMSEESQNEVSEYNMLEYGCPLSSHYLDPFRPVVDLYDDEKLIREVEANFVVWEIFNRTDYTYNATMEEAGCRRASQGWTRILEIDDPAGTLGPHNFESCFNSSDTEQEMDLSQPYEILNSSGVSAIIWPAQSKDNLYLFNLRVVDKAYSFCTLETKFAVLVYGDSKGHDATFEVRVSLGTFSALYIAIAVISYIHFREKHIVQLEERDRLEREELAEQSQQRKRISRVAPELNRGDTRAPPPRATAQVSGRKN